MSALPRATPLRFLSRRAREELGALQESVQELRVYRNAALRIFVASRHAATAMAQRDFWLEFSWADQEYRIAVRRLAEFCFEHREGGLR
ncbi:MAG TPA: hypothetical protein VMT66_03680 [Steroidobacteraceae bacterium]|nr:hypothetical protein [Steroidobacteraceae bacterium]